MPKKADPNKKKGNQYKSKLLADARYTGEGLKKYKEDKTITEEEYNQAMAKARKYTTIQKLVKTVFRTEPI